MELEDGWYRIPCLDTLKNLIVNKQLEPLIRGRYKTTSPTLEDYSADTWILRGIEKGYERLHVQVTNGKIHLGAWNCDYQANIKGYIDLSYIDKRTGVKTIL